MKVMVTGASGFVGTSICSRLQATGCDVIRVAHSNSAGFSGNADYAVDIANPRAFSQLDDIDDLNAIVHCAGIAHRFGKTSKEDYWKVNVQGTENVANFGARIGVGKFIQLSSVLVYGPSISNQPITEQQPPAPVDDYSSSKLAGELAAADVCKSAGIDLAILRPVPIIGEGSRGNVGRLIQAIDRNRFVWIGDGRNERSFVYVSDVAGAVVAALSAKEQFTILNVTGGTITVRELVENISKCLGRGRPGRLVPHRVAGFALSASRPVTRFARLEAYHRTLQTWLADAVYSGEALTNLGFVPTTDLLEAVRREVSFFLDRKDT